MPSVSFSFAWETELILRLQSIAGQGLIRLACIFTLLGEDMLLVAMAGYLYWCRDKELGRRATVNLAGGLALSPMLKNLVMRRRPYFDDPRIVCLRPVDGSAGLYDLAAQGYSFPSMHAADSMNLFSTVAAALKTPRAWALALGLSLLTGLSRVVLGVHYPTDVLAGWLLGLAYMALISRLQSRLGSPVKAAGVLLVLTLPGWFFCRSDDFFSAYGILAALPLSFALEEKYIRFSGTRRLLPAFLRVAGGVGLFLLVSEGLKLPFSEAFLDSGTFPAHLVRSARYCLSGFTILGLYPAIFRFRPFADPDKAP